MLSPIKPAQQGQKLALWFPSCSLRDFIWKRLASVQCEKGKFKKINTDDKNNRKAAKFLKHLLWFPSLPVKSVLWSSAPDVEGFSWYSLFLLLALFYVIEMTSSHGSQKVINCSTYFRNGEYPLSIDAAGIGGGMLWGSARTSPQEEALLRALEAEALGGRVPQGAPLCQCQPRRARGRAPSLGVRFRPLASLGAPSAPGLLRDPPRPLPAEHQRSASPLALSSFLTPCRGVSKSSPQKAASGPTNPSMADRADFMGVRSQPWARKGLALGLMLCCRHLSKFGTLGPAFSFCTGPGKSCSLSQWQRSREHLPGASCWAGICSVPGLRGEGTLLWLHCVTLEVGRGRACAGANCFLPLIQEQMLASERASAGCFNPSRTSHLVIFSGLREACF